ncbi:MAG: hypothetical protein QUS11_10700 [Candidatus Fermentibacter sp.]|nr:hypothetical protein [Candidatus Fermentibacter sp.]
MAYHMPILPVGQERMPIVVGWEYTYGIRQADGRLHPGGMGSWCFYTLVGYWPVTGQCLLRSGACGFWVSEGVLRQRYIGRPGGYNNRSAK